jgi:hypothetical protein
MMDNQQLTRYIEQARKSGITDDKIREGLLQSGWSSVDIESALKGSNPEPQVVTKPKWHPTPVQKWIAIIGVIIILAMSVSYAYVTYLAKKNYDQVALEAKKAQQEMQALAKKRAENPMAAWRTYQNQFYEFKYPDSYTSDTNTVRTEHTFVTFDKKQVDRYGDTLVMFKHAQGFFSIYSSNINVRYLSSFYPNLHSPEDIFSYKETNFYQDSRPGDKFEYITINGIKAYKALRLPFESDEILRLGSLYVEFFVGDKAYEIKLIWGDDDYNEIAIKEFGQILSTFSFTK